MSTSTKPKTKNCTSAKLDSISTRSLERGKVSKTCNVSKDENIPDNKQEMSAIRTVEATVPIMSCDDGQKPSKKKRLNLRTRAAASKGTKAETIEQKVQTALKDTDSSEDTEEQPSLSVKNNLTHNNLDRISDNNGGGNESASKDMEAQNSSIKCCPVCKYNFTSIDSDFRNLDSDAEINEHINKCLDSAKTETKTSNPSEHCQLCGKDISKYNTVQRQQHVNRCCDKLGKTQPKAKPEVSSILCPICGKPFKTAKTRQTHMKKCAKENNVSTHQLVELNRQENINNPTITAVTNSSTAVPRQNNTKPNQDTLGFVRNNKRKRKANLPAKNLDDDTQLALALSASMESDATDVRELGTKRRKKKKENSELPALLLRSDDEMKKVTEARAAAILCQWADNDDEIQCTPALAPSSLVKKYGKESSSDNENLEVLPQQTAECDVEDITERCDSPIIEVRGGSHSKKNEKCGCANESESHGSVTTQGEESKQYFTVNTQSRLWNLASLRADVVTHNDFYVPNLLPKSTPRKKKATRSANSITNEEQLDHSAAVEKDNKDILEDSPSKVSSQNDELTESQQKDIEILVELINDESSDTQSTGNEQEQNEEIDKTWFPSSGFCVRKDMHEIEDQNKEEVDTLLNDLSCMVGNPLLSDVEIVAKDNKKFCAHSFMLSARCGTLAEILHTSETCLKDVDSNGLVRLELLDIDVRAVRAVLTYIYTAYFIPVVENAIEDVKKLVHRWNLNCNAAKWEVIRDGTGRDHEDNVEHGNDDVGDLDVLLKSLWEGEEEIVSGKNENENKFGDSILDDELGDMEIKIYTQATPQKNTRESSDKSAVVLHLDSEDKAVAIAERTGNDVAHSDDEQSNLESNVLENEDEAILQTSDDIMCIPETPLKLSPCCSPEKNDAEETLREDDLTLVEQPADDVLETKTCQSSPSDDTNNGASSLRGHSSPIAKEFNGDELDYLNSSPISLPSPSSPVEMISSPERSPLPENLNDFDMEDESNELNKAHIFSMENSPNMSVSNSPNVCPNKYIAENMNVDGCLNACISIVSPESRNTTSPIYSTNTEDNVATADEDKIKEAEVFSGLGSGNSKLVDQTADKGTCRTRNKLSDKNEDDSLLDIFATSSDSRTEQSPVYNSKQDMKVDSCLDIDISVLSPITTATSPPLHSPNSKDEYIGMEEAETELLKADPDQRDRCPHGANTTYRAKQSLVFNSKDQDTSEEVDSNQENRSSYGENKTHKDVNETTTRQSCNLTNQIDSWLDDSSLQSKDEIYFSQGDRRSHGGKTTNKDVNETTKRKTSSLRSRNRSTEVQSDAQEDCYDDQSTTSGDGNETPRRQSCTGTNKVDSWLDDSSLETKNTPSTEVQSDAQEDCYGDKFMTPKHVNKSITKQSCTITDKADSWLDDSSIKSNNTSNLEAQNNQEENFYDDDQFIDCYDDGGFNCDIDDYFNYDAHSTIEHANVVPEDEKPGTSSATAQDTMESNVEEETTNDNQNVGKNPKKKNGKEVNNVQTTENKKENMSKDVKKGKNNKAEGKTKKSEKEAAGKQAKAKNNTHQEFKLRDPRTPMLDYSNMATPELKGELKQYGVRPLAKRKMVIKLKEIYHYTQRETHSERESDEDDEKKSSKNKQESSEDEEVEPPSEDTNSQQGSTQDTESCSDSEQNWYEEDQPSDDSEMLSQQSSSNLSKTLMSFLTQDHELYFKILKFMPISVSDVLETIKGNGIKCSAEQLKNFFDEQCITYSEPRPARVQRRGRRGKSKMKKV